MFNHRGVQVKVKRSLVAWTMQAGGEAIEFTFIQATTHGISDHHKAITS